MTILRFFKRLLKEQPRRIIVMVFALVVAGFLEGSGVALFVPLLQMISAPSGTQADLGRIAQFTIHFLGYFGLKMTITNVLILIFLIVTGLQVATIAQQKLLFSYQYRYEAELRQRLYKTIFSSEWSFFLRQKAGDITNALMTEANRAGGAFYLINTLIAGTIIIAAYFSLAVIISWRLSLATGILSVLVMLMLQKQIGKAKSEGQDITTANADLQSEAIEQVAGAKLVKGCAIEDETNIRFNERVEALREAQFRNGYNSARVKAFHELTVVGLLCAGIYFATIQLKMPIATLIVFLVIFYRLSPRLTNFQVLRRSLSASLPSVDRIDAFIAEAESMKEKKGTKLADGLSQGVVFKDVGFAYDAGYDVLNCINLTIPKGKTVAIVGTSGAGKSTIVDLIMGLIKPRVGSVWVDGAPLGKYDPKGWRRLIGYVAQDTVLFHASVRANIAWTAPRASLADIEAAAESAYALDFIRQLPQGFETIIGDRGVRLSGGQKQRLALASALIRKPQILILDEATSALDAESEQKIQQAVELLAKSSMTIVIITHRLATVKNADYIYVLEKGEIIEEGDWATLAQSKGRFQALKHLQALD